MTDKEIFKKLEAEIERLENYENESVTNSDTRFGWIHGKTFALTSIRVLLDSMQEEPKSFDEAIQEGDDVRYNEDLGCRVNLSRLKRVAKKEATGKLKECIDNITEESLAKARKQLQEEPKECMYSKDNYTDEDRKALCDGCEEECEFNKKEESVSDSFEDEVKRLWQEINTGHSYSIVDSYNQFYGLCLDIAEWQKEQMVAKAVKVSNTSIVSLPVNCNLKVGDKVLIIKED